TSFSSLPFGGICDGGLTRSLVQASRLRRCRHKRLLRAPPASQRNRSAAGALEPTFGHPHDRNRNGFANPLTCRTYVAARFRRGPAVRASAYGIATASEERRYVKTFPACRNGFA